MNNEINDKLAVSVADFAKMLSVSKPIAYKIIKRDDFNGVIKIGKRTLISVDEAKKWIKLHTNNFKKEI